MTELDYMEYVNDAVIQAEYITSDSGSESTIIDQDSTNNTEQAIGNPDGDRYRQSQSFALTEITTITKVSLLFHSSVGTPAGDITMRIETDSSGKPSGILAHANATKVITPTASQWNDWTFASPFVLQPGTYHMWGACDNQDQGDYWLINADTGNPYGGGTKVTSYDSGSSWTILAGHDLTFRVYGIIANLQCYSEDTIVQQDTYSLKGIAQATDSLNDTLTRTVNPTIDLSGLDSWIFYIYSNRTGSNIKVGIHDSGGTTTETTPNITSAGEWQKIEVDISGVSDANKDDIDSIIITIENADAENIFYIDNMYSESVGVIPNVIFFGTNF